MDQAQLAARIDGLCTRLEDLIAELAMRPGPYAKLRETHPNAGKAWSKTEDEELTRLYASGNSVRDLAVLFGRTENGVKVRLEKLGLLQPAPSARAA